MPFPKKQTCLLSLAFVFICLKGVGQLCQGSLGDPLVKITFGAGPNPGPPLSPGITNFIYQAADCPNDGLYAILNSTYNCFAGTWYNVTADHTGDPNGYFMIVNGSYQPTDFYVDTVRGLCPGTTFEFSAWILNLMKPSACNGSGIKPNVTFSIEKPDKTVIATYTTGDINPSDIAATWLQYGFYFTMPANLTTLVLRMTNNAPGGCGNDLALDDIAFRPCGPTVSILMPGNTENNIHLCAGQSYSLALGSNISSSYANPSYQWQMSTNDTLWTNISLASGITLATTIPTTLPVGSYYYRLGVSESSNSGISACQVYSNVFIVTITAYPSIYIVATNPICQGNTLELQGPSDDSCVWTGPLGFMVTNFEAQVPNVQKINEGEYYITATSKAGCTSHDSIAVKVLPRPFSHVRSDTAICIGTPIALQGEGNGVFAWTPTTGLSNPQIADPIATPDRTTRYLLTVLNNGCADTASVLIQVFQKPTANAGPDRKIFEGQQVQLNGSASGSSIHYYWTPITNINNDTTIAPTVSPTDNTTYTLHVVSDVGCGTATDDVIVSVYKKLVVPTAFSPNNDGINDVWDIPLINSYPNVSVTIFDRYGKMVFESNGYSKPWNGTFNGKPVPVGTYYYIIDTKTVAPKLNGSVFVIR